MLKNGQRTTNFCSERPISDRHKAQNTDSQSFFVFRLLKNGFVVLEGVWGVGSSANLCGMYFKIVVRINPATGQLTGYYRLVKLP
ncbi:MAG: hypothetical protein IPI42_10735 [Saprospiraceae bacterium]|nr:hypothetical protein [Candidatus Parvibacillus calidus]